MSAVDGVPDGSRRNRVNVDGQRMANAVKKSRPSRASPGLRTERFRESEMGLCNTKGRRYVVRRLLWNRCTDKQVGQGRRRSRQRYNTCKKKKLSIGQTAHRTKIIDPRPEEKKGKRVKIRRDAVMKKDQGYAYEDREEMQGEPITGSKV